MLNYFSVCCRWSGYSWHGGEADEWRVHGIRKPLHPVLTMLGMALSCNFLPELPCALHSAAKEPIRWSFSTECRGLHKFLGIKLLYFSMLKLLQQIFKKLFLFCVIFSMINYVRKLFGRIIEDISKTRSSMFLLFYFQLHWIRKPVLLYVTFGRKSIRTE